LFDVALVAIFAVLSFVQRHTHFMHFDMQMCCYVSPVAAMTVELFWYMRRLLDVSRRSRS
jgi:hypothetical protein